MRSGTVRSKVRSHRAADPTRNGHVYTLLRPAPEWGLEAASPTTVTASHRGYKLRAELRPQGRRETQRKPQFTMTTAETRRLPAYDELPKFKDFSGCAWEVWGKDDQLGTINLLTDDVVKEASKEIKSGKAICLNWPIQFPSRPAFGRITPTHEVIFKTGRGAVHDDILHINTQSGTQWDGLKHFGLLEHGVFYQNTPATFFQTGKIKISNPTDVDPELIKFGIHNWAQHGICGRGVLLDMVKYYCDANGGRLPYDPMTTHAIPAADLIACAKQEGITFRTGDILLIRAGFMQRFYSTTQEERDGIADKPETFAGIEQSEDMKRFLWDNHFAAVASDQPALERWPPPGPHLHQTILGLWGMPIGEFFDLEALSKQCEETGRYTFFFSSWPLNVLGGVASPPNAAAYF
ncbi:putative cyclase-domain-containing protein [Cubamyces lactineus]|nr:putative cyclase-domain-containing protein [Cubamyces lactineus]